MLIIDMPKKYLTDASGFVSCANCQKYLPLLYRDCHNDFKGCLIKGELPEQHGRLIDADALWELMRTYDDYQGAKEAHDLELIHRDSILFAIETVPSVIAAERKDDEQIH